MAEAMDIDNDHKSKNVNLALENNLSPKQRKGLDYLLEQADLFSHFFGNSPKQAAKRKIAREREQKKTSNRHRNRSQSQDGENGDGHATGVRFETTPTYINGVMRDYQLRGLNWIISLQERGINGILADEMGLGKTLQTISVLGFLKNYKLYNGPFLVIGPKSTLRNWFNEVNRFCPTLKPIILIGNKESRAEVLHQMKNRKTWDVLLTTYEMILSEQSALKQYHWKYLVVDEAHRLKNENSKLSTVLRTFKSDNRLLLTGTPLQNNLHELWALLNFLLPDVFASSDDFDTWFNSDDCLRGNSDIVHRLHAILRPFMLRRIKAEVEKSLLPKIEVKLYVGLTTLQRETYKTVLLKEVKKLNTFGEETTKAINNILIELRKAANHPYLIDNVEPGPPYTTDKHIVDNCGKMMLLDSLLAKLKEQGSRVVLFSQFVIMLDILEDYLVWRGHEYRRLDGQTPYEDRAKGIDDFNAENSKVFIYIISTRAGGLGINLATADTVIIYDSDWNPQPDFQAIDRVHRIGQTKQVRVFRLVTENTIDERVIQRAEIKARLDKMVIQQGRSIDELTELTKGMKKDMIRFGAEQILSAEKGSDVIDIDIDKILKYGEEKTAEENAKYAEMGESELTTLTLEEASSVSVYQFEGEDFRLKQKNDNNYRLRQQAIRNYAPVTAVQSMMPKIPRNMKFLHSFQMYPPTLYALCEENSNWINMAVDTEKKKELLEKGFPDWNKNHFLLFLEAMVKCGRNELEEITKMIPEKTLDDVRNYHRAFWKHGNQRIRNFGRYIVPLLKNESSKAKEKFMYDALQWKISCYNCPEIDMTIKYSGKWRHPLPSYTRDQDVFILLSFMKHGMHEPNVYIRIRHDILSSRRFCFDFFFHSRTAADLEKRLIYLMNAIHSEYTEHTQKNTSTTLNTTGENSTGGPKKRTLKGTAPINMTIA